MDNHTSQPANGETPAPISAVPSAPVTAMISLVFGILSLPSAVACVGVLAAVPAIVCGHLARRQIRQSGNQARGAGMALAGLITGYVGLLISLAVIGTFTYYGYQGYKIASARNDMRRDDCASRLQQVALACDCYADDHDEAYPPDFATLYKTYLPDAQALVCAEAKHAPAETREDLRQTQYQDYAYFGAGIRRDSVTEKARTILAAERPGKHADKKMSIVFCDGHAETFTGDSLDAVTQNQGLLLPHAGTGQPEKPAAVTKQRD